MTKSSTSNSLHTWTRISSVIRPWLDPHICVTCLLSVDRLREPPRGKIVLPYEFRAFFCYCHRHRCRCLFGKFYARGDVEVGVRAHTRALFIIKFIYLFSGVSDCVCSSQKWRKRRAIHGERHFCRSGKSYGNFWRTSKRGGGDGKRGDAKHSMPEVWCMFY